MSLINDALKQAQKAPPTITPSTQAPHQPAAQHAVPVARWLAPAVVILLMVTAAFIIGLAMAHRAMTASAPVPESAASTPANAVTPTTSKPASAPAVAAAPAETAPVKAAPAPEPMQQDPQFFPRVQGIFYSPAGSTAILDDKTVRVGDHFKQYVVKEIGKNSVTLVSADGKPITVVMDN